VPPVELPADVTAADDPAAVLAAVLAELRAGRRYRGVVPGDRAWFDPRLLLVNTQQTITEQVVALGAVVPILVPNPGRVAFSVACSTQFNLAPWPDADLVPWYQTGTAGHVTVTLFAELTAVTLGWWVFVPGVTTVRTIETVRV